MKTKITQTTLMKAGDEMFWDHLDTLSGQAGERYMVVDKTNQTILVSNAKLLKKKERVEI